MNTLLIIITMLLIAPLSATQPDTPPTAKPKENLVFPSIQKIIDAGVLKFAISASERPPFFFTNKSGELDGVDIRMAKAIAAALGVKAEFIQTEKDFDEVVNQVARGTAHMAISKLSFNEKRFKKVLYTYPYATVRFALLVNRAALEKFTSKDSLADIFANNRLRISTVGGSSKVLTAQEMFPNAELVLAPTYDESYDKVYQEDCFACLSDEIEVLKLLLKDPKYNLKCAVVILEGTKDNLNIITNPDLPQLDSMVRSMITSRTDMSFKLEDICKQYEKDIKEYTPPSPKAA